MSAAPGTGPGRPEFATNRETAQGRETVADAVNALLRGYREQGAIATRVAVASAYFNVDGWCLLADELEQSSGVRLLLGAEPVDAVQHRTVRPLAGRPLGRRRATSEVPDPLLLDPAVEEHLHALEQDRDLLGFSLDADARAQRLIRWLRAGDVEVRRLTKDFLHGKLVLLETWNSAAIAGSSNLTHAGLAVNHELNLGVYNPTPVAQVTGWFDGLWDVADPFDLAALYEDRHDAQQPIDVFLRMLWERYGSTLEEETQHRSELGLTQFQQDGVWRAQRLLDERRGVIVADEVGLGKTYTAGELIRRAAVDRRQKVLVVAPATLRDSTWEPFLRDKVIPATVVSYEQLVSDLAGGTSVRGIPLDDYAMVVVDEAHHLRTATTQRADAMRKLLGGQAAKDLVLLTATPVNNSLLDLHTLISYITPADSAFADVGVPSLQTYFRQALAHDPQDLSPEHLFTVLDEIAVRRTRRFVKTYYEGETVWLQGREVPIAFPTPTVSRVDYDLSGVLPGFFDQLATALGADLDDDDLEASGVVLGHEGRVLTMARYVPSRFELSRPEGDAEQYQAQNAGLLRSALLKRFESSAVAFASTVDVMLGSFAVFLDALDQGWVLTGDALRAWTSSTGDDIDEVVRSALDSEKISQGSAQPALSYDVEALRAAVTADRALLESLRDQVRRVHWRDDPKVEALVAELGVIAVEAEAEGIGADDTRNRRKVLLFTYFATTAQYLQEALADLAETDPRLEAYRDRVVVVTGRDGHDRSDRIAGFAPLTAGPRPDTSPGADRYDLAIATDVLAEGVNLQQARHIVNFDLPWNPMRLVQRHGRVDRIGSPHERIELRCFFPSAELEVLLDLEARLQRKLHQAAVAFGTSAVLPGVEAVDRSISETREEIRRLRAGDARILDGPAGAASSGEEYRRRLLNAFASEATKHRVLSMAGGAGTGMVVTGARAGVVFCARVADNPQPDFRFVPLTDDLRVRELDGAAVVEGDLLGCLVAADPGRDDVPAALTDDLREAAFSAWKVARADIAADWERRRDPAAGAPEVPKVMRDAAALVREHGAGLGDEQGDVVKRLGQVVVSRVQQEIRRLLAAHADAPAAGAAALARAVRDLRLPVPEQPRRLPRIDPEADIQLVTWTAVVTPAATAP